MVLFNKERSQSTIGCNDPVKDHYIRRKINFEWTTLSVRIQWDIEIPPRSP